VAGQGAISSGSGTDSLHLNRATFIDYGSPLTASGPVTFKDQVDSTSALAVQTASSANVLVVDTTNSKIGIDTVPAATGASLQVAGNIDISGQYLVNGRPLSLASLSGTTNATLQGNGFNGPGQLVQLTGTGLLPLLNGSNLTNLNASNTSSGTLSDQRLSANVALLNSNNSFTGANSFTNSGNSFSGDGSGLTSVNAATLNGQAGAYYTDASNLSSGTVADARLSTNVALLNANQTFSGSNVFSGPFKFQSATNAQNAFQIQNQAGNDNLLVADTINTRIGIGLDSSYNGGLPQYTLDVGGDINIANNQVYRINGVTVCSNVGCTPNGSSNAYVQLQASTPGTAQSGNANITGTVIAGSFSGSGMGLTNLDASQIASGTVNNARLDSSTVTLQGNTFNGAAQLVQTTALSYFPALNGSLITNLAAGNIAAGTLNDARLSTNVPLLNANQTFSGNNTFSNVVIAPGIQTTSAGHIIDVGFTGTASGAVTYNFDVAAAPNTYTICTTAGNCAGAGGGVTTPGGTTNKLAKFTGAQTLGDSQILDNGSQVLINQLSGTYQLDVAGDINSTTGLRVGGNLVCNSSGCGTGSGSGFYIQNGTGLQTGANFNIRSASSAGVVAVLEGASGQTADLLDVQSFGGSSKYLSVTTTGISVTGNINTTGSYQAGGIQISSTNLSNDANLAKLNGTGPQAFTGNNSFAGTLLQKNTGTNVFQIQKADGSGTVFIADTSDTRIGIGVQPAYTLDVAGDVNISTGSFYRVNGVAICGSAATCAPSSGSTNYIQNSVAQQTSANFNIQSTATGSIVGILQGKSGQTADILDLKDGSANIVLSVGNQGQTLVKDSSAGSSTFFQIQNSSSVSLLTANTTTGQILFPNATLSSTALLLGGFANLYAPSNANLKTDNNFIIAGSSVVGEASINPTYKLEVAGSINLTSGNSYYIAGTPICSSSGCAPASGSNNYVQLQSSTPGTQQTGNFNISGTGLFGGSVGIGVSSPPNKLVVAGSLTYTSDPTYAIAAADSSNNNLKIMLGYDVADNAGVLQSANHNVAWTNTLINPNGGNVGIGLTGPTDKLQVAAGTAGYYTSIGASGCGGTYGGIAFDLQLSGACANYSLLGDGTSTLLNSPSGDLKLRIGNADKLDILASNGNVGIGTTSPGSKLSISSAVYTGNTLPALGANSTFLSVLDAAGNYGLIGGVQGSGNAFLQAQRVDGTATAYNMLLQPNGGNVGIGTTGLYSGVGGTNAKVAIASTDDSQSGLVIGNGTNPRLAINGLSTGAFTMYDYAAGSWTAGITQKSGNVGIGTTTPGATGPNGITVSGPQLEIKSATTGADVGLYVRRSDNAVGFDLTSDNNTAGIIYMDSRYNNSAGGFQFRTETAGTAINAMRIDGSGNIGIGTTGPGYKLDVNGNANIATTLYGAGKEALTMNDSYLRINQSNTFSSGVWFGSSNVQMDTGHLQLGTNGGGVGEVDISGTSGDSTNRITINGNANANSWFNTGGNVGIGMTPSYKLDIQLNAGERVRLNAVSTGSSDYASGMLRIDTLASPSSGNSFAQFYTPSDIKFNFVTNGYAYADGSWNGGGADVAEWTPTTQATTLTAGDVLVADGSNDQSLVKKSGTTPYDSTVVGIVSTNPGLVAGAGSAETQHGSSDVLVTLSGRVPVKISGENGPVTPGDYLTTSSTPGYAMKATRAGSVIAKALTAFGGTTSSDRGTVIAFVSISYYNPVTDELLGGTLDATNINLSGDLTIADTATFNGDIVVNGHVIGNSDTSGSLNVPAGQTTASYSFAKAYTSTPHVVVTPTDDTGSLHWWITKTTTSFTLNLSTAAPSALDFDYFVQQ
jgi:hypothetical protein